jgi:polyisoprenoid-binding protein YceI
MKGINKEVVLDVEIGGYIKDPYGNERQPSPLTAGLIGKTGD